MQNTTHTARTDDAPKPAAAQPERFARRHAVGTGVLPRRRHHAAHAEQRVCSLPHRRRVGLVRRGAGVHRLSPDADGCGSWRLVDATAADVQERPRQVLLDGTLVRDWQRDW